MTEHETAHGEHGGSHVVSIKLLAAVLGALILLTWVTVAATWLDMGAFNLWLALAIAVVKATLVALYFMHLRWDRPINALFFVGSLVFIALFIGLALMDTQSYHEELIPGYAPAAQR